jgi:hypothetical protein
MVRCCAALRTGGMAGSSARPRLASVPRRPSPSSCQRDPLTHALARHLVRGARRRIRTMRTGSDRQARAAEGTHASGRRSSRRRRRTSAEPHGLRCDRRDALASRPRRAGVVNLKVQYKASAEPLGGALQLTAAAWGEGSLQLPHSRAYSMASEIRFVIRYYIWLV